MQLHIKRGNLESETKYGWEGDLTILMEREKKELVEEKNTLDRASGKEKTETPN